MVEYKDLCGYLEGMPLAIVRLMLIRQFEQTRSICPVVFQRSIRRGRATGGMNWDETREGSALWLSLLIYRRFYQLPLHYTNDIAVFPNTDLISECYDRKS